MIGNIWSTSNSAAKYLGITKLTFLSKEWFFKTGVHWKSSPYGQKKPWNPEALYVKICKNLIDKISLEDFDVQQF